MGWFGHAAKGVEIPVLRVEELPRPAYVFGGAARSAAAGRSQDFPFPNQQLGI